MKSILDIYYEVYFTTLMALGNSFMNSISQMTQQELSNLPRAFRGQARDGAQVGPTPGKAQLFPSKSLSLTSGNPQNGFEVSRKQ